VGRPRAGAAGRRALQPRERRQDLPQVLGPGQPTVMDLDVSGPPPEKRSVVDKYLDHANLTC
jgi:hypothetical protein